MQYPKIKNVYTRNLLTHKPIEGFYTTPEIEYLADYKWRFTEKVHGINIRLQYDPVEYDEGLLAKIDIKGKRNLSNIPTHLLHYLSKLLDVNRLKTMFNTTLTTLYGEGYGYKINGGGHYFKDSSNVGFILFDVNYGGIWLDPYSVNNVALELSLKCVPWRCTCNLSEAVKVVKRGLTSILSYEHKFVEGLVGVPELMLLNRHGKRIQVKIKHSDFYGEKNNGHS